MSFRAHYFTECQCVCDQFFERFGIIQQPGDHLCGFLWRSKSRQATCVEGWDIPDDARNSEYTRIKQTQWKSLIRCGVKVYVGCRKLLTQLSLVDPSGDFDARVAQGRRVLPRILRFRRSLRQSREI